MKDLLLNFTVDKFSSLPPTEMLAFVVMALVALFVSLTVLGLALGGIGMAWNSIRDGFAYYKDPPDKEKARGSAFDKDRDGT